MNLIKTVNASSTMHSEAPPFDRTIGRPCGDGFFEPRTEILFSKCHGKAPTCGMPGDAFWNRVARAGQKGKGRLFVEFKNKSQMADAYNDKLSVDPYLPVYEAPSYGNPDSNHWVDCAREDLVRCVGYVFAWDGRMNYDGDLMPARTATPRSTWVLVKF